MPFTRPLLAALALALLSCAAAAASAPAAGQIITLCLPGGERSYRLHRPALSATAPLPLVIALHGHGSGPAAMAAMTGFSALADRENFAVAYPQGEGRQAQWRFMGRDAKDEIFIRAMIDDIARRLPLDRARIYLTGISNGAQMTARLACIAPELFAAIAPVAGNYMSYADCRTGLPMPAVIFHGNADNILPYDGREARFSPQHYAESRARDNGCAPAPSTVFQRSEVSAQGWGNCQGNADVVFYTIDGKGHSWPGSAMPPAITTRTIGATEIIWAFFRRHTR